jgi:hypothetical protein
MRDEVRTAIAGLVKDIQQNIKSFEHFLTPGAATSNHIADWGKKKADEIAVNFFTLHAVMEQLTTEELREIFTQDTLLPSTEEVKS